MKYAKSILTVLALLTFVLILGTGCKEKLDTTWGKSATLGQKQQSVSTPANDNGSMQSMWSNLASTSAQSSGAKEIKSDVAKKK